MSATGLKQLFWLAKFTPNKVSILPRQRWAGTGRRALFRRRVLLRGKPPHLPRSSTSLHGFFSVLLIYFLQQALSDLGVRIHSRQGVLFRPAAPKQQYLIALD
jgi:hypothetical protein